MGIFSPRKPYLTDDDPDAPPDETYSKKLGRLFGTDPADTAAIDPKLVPAMASMSDQENQDQSKPKFNLSTSTQSPADVNPPFELADKSHPQGYAGSLDTTKPDHEGLGAKLKRIFLGQDIPGGTDEYGLQTPGVHKQGVLAKILQYALPIAESVREHQGIIPGAAIGFFGGENRQMRQENLADTRYDRQRSQAMNQEYRKSMEGLNQNKLLQGLQLSRDKMDQSQQQFDANTDIKKILAEETLRHNKEMEGISKDKVSNKPPNPKELEFNSSRDAIKNTLEDMKDTLSRIPAGAIGGRLSEYGAKVGLGSHADDVAAYESARHILAGELAKMSVGRVNQQEYQKYLENVMPSPTHTEGQRAAKFNQIEKIMEQQLASHRSSLGLGTPGGSLTTRGPSRGNQKTSYSVSDIDEALKQYQ